MNKMTINHRVTVYDQMRLLATFLVVLGHSTYTNIVTDLGGVSYVLSENVSKIYYSAPFHFWRAVQRWTYGFHMPLFFVLSGALFAFSRNNTLVQIGISKFKRMIIPYFVWGYFFMLPIKYISDFYDKNSILSAYKVFWRGRESGYLWFLLAIFWCTIIFATMLKILKCLKIDKWWIILFISILCRCFYVFIPADILSSKTGISYILFFALGFLFELYIREKISIAISFSGTILFLIVEILNHFLHFLNSELTIFSGCIFIIFLSFTFDFTFKKIYTKKLWNVTIRNLFYVYLIHDPLEYVVLKIYFNKDYLVSTWGCISYAFMRIFILFIISVLLGEVIHTIKNYVSPKYFSQKNR